MKAAVVDLGRFDVKPSIPLSNFLIPLLYFIPRRFLSGPFVCSKGLVYRVPFDFSTLLPFSLNLVLSVHHVGEWKVVEEI